MVGVVDVVSRGLPVGAEDQDLAGSHWGSGGAQHA
jgi:hypothetical protein